MSVTIKPISTSKELDAFIRFNYDLYKDCPYAVPELYGDLKKTFDPKKNAAFEFCESQMYLAYRDGKIVGRVAAIINHKANEIWKTKCVRFGWIDFIDDVEVADTLIHTVEQWGKEKGMNEIQGPLGFIDFDREGMLVEGFDQMATFITNYNYPYYPQHLERLGFVKDVDWVEYKLTVPKEIPERLTRISAVVRQKFGYRIKKYTNRKQMAKEMGYPIFRLFNKAYANLYGFTPLSDRQIDLMIEGYLSLVDLRLISFVVDAEGNLAGAGMLMPSLAKATQKAGGRMFPFGWWHMAKAMWLKHSDTVELLLVAVKPELQGKGLNALIIEDIVRTLNELGYKYGESNPELENNFKVQAQWEVFERTNHKRRRAYKKDIE